MLRCASLACDQTKFRRWVLQRSCVEGGKQPTGGLKALYDSGLVQLLGCRVEASVFATVAVSDWAEWHR